ncbi:MAG: anti-sigma regulatory factor [Clostridia bacterium]|jgi:serine/threonine-protein kinase RsbW|nr:anti-sigma regulatory factor [Clostridia bacterium]
MTAYKNEFVMYGLNNYLLIIEEIIDALKARDYEFDIKMILVEAITNAFYHGNNCDDKRPIYVRYALDCDNVTFEIEDCGGEIEDLDSLKCIDFSDLLNEGNRGLYLIGCYAEKIEYNNRILKVEKSIAVKNL